jgi:hypothetical protein
MLMQKYRIERAVTYNLKTTQSDRHTKGYAQEREITQYW